MSLTYALLFNVLIIEDNIYQGRLRLLIIPVLLGFFLIFTPDWNIELRAQVLVNDVELDFGEVGVNASVERTLRLINTSNVARRILSVSLQDDDFFLVQESCSVIGINQSCNIRVRFTPNATGFQGGFLSIISQPDTSCEFCSVENTFQLNGIGVPAANVSASDASADENANPGVFTISLSNPAPFGGLTINYSVAGTATPGDDYQSLSGQVFIPTGQFAADIIVTPLNDLEIEQTETVILTLESGSGYVQGVSRSATVNIIDDPPPLITVNATDPNAAEEGRNPGVFTFTSSEMAPAGGLSVNYTVTGTATPGSDYTALPGTATIAAGQSSVSIEVSPIEDFDFAEGNETVIITLRDGSGYLTGSPDNATVIIQDEGPPAATVSAVDPNAAEEGEDPGTFTITLSEAAPPGGLTLSYRVGGDATAAVDYAALPGTATIAGGNVSVDINVNPIVDTEVEGNETVVITLQPGNGYVVGSPDSATVNIQDKRIPIVTVIASDDSADEDGLDKGTFTIVLDISASADLEIAFEIGGTASANDIETLPDQITIPAGMRSVNIEVIPRADDRFEDTETVTLTLQEGSDYDVGSPDSATISIRDNSPQAPRAIIVEPPGSRSVSVGAPLRFAGRGVPAQGGSPDTLSYRWAFGSGAEPATSDLEVPGEVIFNQTGRKTIVFTVTDQLTGLSDSDDLIISVIAGPSARIDAPDNGDRFRAGRAIDFSGTGSDPDGSVLTYSWNFGADATPSESTDEDPQGIVFSEAGTKIITFTVTDSDGQSASDSIEISINDIPDFDPYTDTPNEEEIIGVVVELCTNQAGSDEFQRDCDDLLDAAIVNDPGTSQAVNQITPGSLRIPLDAAQTSVAAQTANIRTRLISLRQGRTGIDVDGLNLDFDAWAEASFSAKDVLIAMESLSGGAASADTRTMFNGRLGIFASGNIHLGDKEETENQDGFDFQTAGLTLGADYRFSDRLIMGGALSYSNTDTTVDENGGDLQTDGYTLTLYGTYYISDLIYIDASLGYGWNDYDQQRRLNYQLESGSIVQNFNADYQGNILSFDIGAGYDFTVDNFVLTPSGRLTYVDAGVDSYSERAANNGPGSGWAVSVDEQNLRSLTLSLGAQATWEFQPSWGSLSPYIQLEWLHEFENESYVVTGRFLEADDVPENAFRLTTDSLDKNYFMLGVGSSARFGNGASAFIEYRKIVGYENLDQHSINAGFRWDF